MSDILAALVVAAAVFGLGVWVLDIHYESVLVERGHAYYHPQTGAFTWKAEAAVEAMP